MPQTAEFAGSIRTQGKDIRDIVREAFYDVCLHSARSVHPECKVEVAWEELYPATINDGPSVEKLKDLFSEFIPHENLFPEHKPLLGSEDFSLMLEKAPGVMMLLGVALPNSDLMTNPYLHSPNFDIDERALALGVQLFANIAFGDVPNRPINVKR